jgi:hypothetical protein
MIAIRNSSPYWFLWVVLTLLAGQFGLVQTADAAEEHESKAGPRVIASDYPDLHAAVAALPGRTGEIYLPKGEYRRHRRTTRPARQRRQRSPLRTNLI